MIFLTVSGFSSFRFLLGFSFVALVLGPGYRSLFLFSCLGVGYGAFMEPDHGPKRGYLLVFLFFSFFLFLSLLLSLSFFPVCFTVQGLTKPRLGGRDGLGPFNGDSKSD